MTVPEPTLEELRKRRDDAHEAWEYAERREQWPPALDLSVPIARSVLAYRAWTAADRAVHEREQRKEPSP